MKEYHDTNQTYDSCKDCEELAKEVLRVVKERDKLEAEICRLEMIWETERGDNNRLKKEIETSNVSIKNHALKIESQSLRVSELGEVLRELIFTASKLWDDAKPIKDADIMKVTHPTIESAKQLLNKL